MLPADGRPVAGVSRTRSALKAAATDKRKLGDAAADVLAVLDRELRIATARPGRSGGADESYQLADDGVVSGVRNWLGLPPPKVRHAQVPRPDKEWWTIRACGAMTAVLGLFFLVYLFKVAFRPSGAGTSLEWAEGWPLLLSFVGCVGFLIARVVLRRRADD